MDREQIIDRVITEIAKQPKPHTQAVVQAFLRLFALTSKNTWILKRTLFGSIAADVHRHLGSDNGLELPHGPQEVAAEMRLGIWKDGRFAELLEAAKVTLGASDNGLARLLHVTPPTVKYWRTGRYMPSQPERICIEIYGALIQLLEGDIPRTAILARKQFNSDLKAVSQIELDRVRLLCTEQRPDTLVGAINCALHLLHQPAEWLAAQLWVTAEDIAAWQSGAVVPTAEQVSAVFAALEKALAAL